MAEVDRRTAAGDWAFGFVAYEASPAFDPGLPVARPSGDGLPLVWFGLCAPPLPVQPITARSELPVPAVGWSPQWSDDEYRSAVATVRDHIAAGQTYQCNLTDRLVGDDVDDPEDLYADLAIAQRGAYNAYLDLGRHVIASASPELFFEWRGETVRTRPMKGTAARGSTTEEDREAARRLLASPKERAENLMIVDLLRNDLSRVARTGSVEVSELFTLERYPTVWQMTSEVTARVEPGIGLVDLFRALFPCGSVTGAPKRRTMQLIRDLEPAERGVYCGAVGFMAPPGSPVRARFSVAIRTAVVDRSTRTAEYGVGSGITWDSDPEAERAELNTKALVLSAPRGDHGLIETFRWLATGTARNLEVHLARLADSADYFGFRCDAEDIRAAMQAAVGGTSIDTRVRVLLERTGQVTVQTDPLGPTDQRPIRLEIDDEPVSSADPWLRHKTTRRDVFRTRAARHPDAEQVVLVNERGELTETTVATLAVRIGGTWWTPPTRSGCLAGVERGRLLKDGAIHVRVLFVDDLTAAEDVAVISSLHGWRPAFIARASAHAASSARCAPVLGMDA